jgi:hypothetical protein
VGYDVEFIQVPLPPDLEPPIPAQTARSLVENAIPFEDPQAVQNELLKLEGCKAGAENTVDFLGRGLNYARLIVRDKTVHVENNCGAPELLKLYNQLAEKYPSLLIYDLQNKQLHNADSFKQWWQKPL